MKNLKNKKGITLVEVIVVLVIMAILAGVLVGVYTGYIQKAREKAEIQEARSALLAIQTLFYEDYAAGKVNESGKKIENSAASETSWYDTTVDGRAKTLGQYAGTVDKDTVAITNATVTAFTYTTESGHTYKYASGVFEKQ